jgi:acetyl esterase
MMEQAASGRPKLPGSATIAGGPVDYLTDVHLAPGIRDFLKIANAPGNRPIESLPLPAARQVLVDSQKAFKVDYSGVKETEKTIRSDGFTIKLNLMRSEGASMRSEGGNEKFMRSEGASKRSEGTSMRSEGTSMRSEGASVRSEGGNDTLPAFLFVHGGGWVLGDYPTHRRLVRDLVVASGYAAVFVNFTTSPEARYPRQVEEIYAATKWVAAHGGEIGVDGGNLAVIGNSAGGNMAGATALMAKDKGGPKIKLLVMMWPATDASFSQQSYELYGAQRFLTTPLMKWSWDQYSPDLAKRKERYASLLNNTAEDLKGLPPTLIQVAENDILRDEGEAFGRKLEEAGVQVTTVRYDGMIHDWGMLNGLAEEPGTRSLVLHAAAELKYFLG